MIMHKSLLASLLLCLLMAPASLPAQEESEATAIYCAKVYVGNGQVHKNAYIVVKDGRIVSVSQDRPEEGTTIIDAGTKPRASPKAVYSARSIGMGALAKAFQGARWLRSSRNTRRRRG